MPEFHLISETFTVDNVDYAEGKTTDIVRFDEPGDVIFL